MVKRVCYNNVRGAPIHIVISTQHLFQTSSGTFSVLQRIENLRLGFWMQIGFYQLEAPKWDVEGRSEASGAIAAIKLGCREVDFFLLYYSSGI